MMRASTIHVLDRPTTDEVSRQAMLAMVEEVRALVETGDIAAIVMVPIRADKSFRVLKSGSLRRIETIGYLAQVQHDLLNDDAQ